MYCVNRNRPFFSRTFLLRQTTVLLSAAILFSAGCGIEQASAPSSEPSLKTKSINWVIAVNGTIPDQAWSSYTVMNQISAETGVFPKLEILTKDYQATLLKRLQSNQLMDMLTLQSDDTLLTCMPHIPTVHPVCEFPSLTNLLPEDIRSFHSRNGKLYYLPGGFTSGDAEIPSEGVFIRKAVYKALHSPPINTTQQLLEAIHAYRDWYRDTVSETLQGYTPVVLGEAGEGMYTLEHLMGIWPENKVYAPTSIQPTPSLNVQPLLELLGKLKECGVTASSMNIDFYELDDCLDSQAFVYIGNIDRLEKYNRSRPENSYIPIQPVLSKTGFLRARSPYGDYATFFCGAEETLPWCVKLTEYLLSEKGSRTAMLGIEKQHWLQDESGKFVAFPDVEEKLSHYNREFISANGIALLPYLSRIGSTYPQKQPKSIVPLIDLLPTIRSLQHDPTTQVGVKQYHFEEQIKKNYQMALETE